jgi:hypothetical protein
VDLLSPSPPKFVIAKQVAPRSRWRGIAFATIGLAALAGIGFEARRVKVANTPVASIAPALNAHQAVPSAGNVIEDRRAGNEQTSPDAQFNAALAQFNQAVAAKDAAALKLVVLPGFQRIAREGGARANDAQGYVSSAIPQALRRMTPWPQISCGVDAPDPGTVVQSGPFVACGVPRLVKRD